MNTLVGELFNAQGIATRQIPLGGRFWTRSRIEAWSASSRDVSRTQPPVIPVLYAGGERAGEVVHLHRTDSALWIVAHADVDPAGRDLFWTAETETGPGGITITAVGLTPEKPLLGLRPVKAMPGSLDWSGAAKRWQLDGPEKQVLERAAASVVERRHARSSPLIVYDQASFSTAVYNIDRRRLGGELEFRSARPIGMDGRERSITLIAMPYEAPAYVEHRGRMVVEIVARSAFDGIERRPTAVRVNRDHSVERTCGRVVSFDPDHAVGLLTEVRIAKTVLGDETLALASDGCLDASAGFRIKPGGEQWEGGRRRLTALHIDHVAMTPSPAYEAARVLDVRTGRDYGQTPNLDAVLRARADALTLR